MADKSDSDLNPGFFMVLPVRLFAKLLHKYNQNNSVSTQFLCFSVPFDLNNNLLLYIQVRNDLNCLQMFVDFLIFPLYSTTVGLEGNNQDVMRYLALL